MEEFTVINWVMIGLLAMVGFAIFCYAFAAILWAFQLTLDMLAVCIDFVESLLHSR